MVIVERVLQKSWDYILYRGPNGHILSVLCGTVGMYTLNIPLNDYEESQAQLEGGLDALANTIRSTPAAYSSRSVGIVQAGS